MHAGAGFDIDGVKRSESDDNIITQSRSFTYSYCSTTLTEVCPCFFLRCKANARV
jgi:hypothetical protein